MQGLLCRHSGHGDCESESRAAIVFPAWTGNETIKTWAVLIFPLNTPSAKTDFPRISSFVTDGITNLLLDEDWSPWHRSQPASNMMMSSRHHANRAIQYSKGTRGAHVIPGLFILITLRIFAHVFRASLIVPLLSMHFTVLKGHVVAEAALGWRGVGKSVRVGSSREPGLPLWLLWGLVVDESRREVKGLQEPKGSEELQLATRGHQSLGNPPHEIWS